MRRAALALVILSISAGEVAAQTAPIRLTLDQAIARGLEASHRLAELSAREEAARAAVEIREAAARPQMTVLAGYLRTNHVDEFGVPRPTGGIQVIYPDIPDNYRSRVDLQWPIYTAGRTAALSGAAGAEADAIEQDRAAAAADVRLEITRAYWAVMTAQASVSVVAEALKRMEGHLGDVRNRLNVGLVPPSDVLSLEAQRSRQQMLLIEAGNIVEATAADFRRLVGLAPCAGFELADRLEDAPLRALQGASDLVSDARGRRHERAALGARAAAADLRREAIDAARRPQVSVAGGYDVARPNPLIFPRRAAWEPSWDLSVNVAWSLWDGGRVRAERAEAEANERAVEQRLQEFDNLLEVDVRQRLLDLESAHAAITAATDGVRSAAEARRVITERFAAGVATNTEVIDAQLVLLQAELDRTRALAAARLAQARLDRSLGR